VASIPKDLAVLHVPGTRCFGPIAKCRCRVPFGGLGGGSAVTAGRVARLVVCGLAFSGLTPGRLRLLAFSGSAADARRWAGPGGRPDERPLRFLQRGERVLNRDEAAQLPGTGGACMSRVRHRKLGEGLMGSIMERGWGAICRDVQAVCKQYDRRIAPRNCWRASAKTKARADNWCLAYAVMRDQAHGVRVNCSGTVRSVADLFFRHTRAGTGRLASNVLSA